MLNVAASRRMREFDSRMINDMGVDGILLTERAADAVAERVIRRGGKCVILIGPGNNGGYGMALMRILRLSGINAAGVLLCDPDEFKGGALKNYQIARNCNLCFTDRFDCMENADIIVDAVFGAGHSKPVSGIAREAISLANSSKAYKIAVDIPSGMNGDTGEIMGIAFNADETVTFQCIKRGLLLTKEREKAGKITVAPIAVPDAEYEKILEKEQLIDFNFVNGLLPERKSVSNKGNFGKALIIAGSRGMTGSAVLCANACLRAGAGLTKAFVPKEIIGAFSVLPEVMTLCDGADGNPADETLNKTLDDALNWADAAGIGCGAGNDPNKYGKLTAVLKARKPAVIDADGLNCMDENAKRLLNKNCVITPHPMEMARLIKKDIKETLSNPVEIAENFAKTYNCVVLLKSAVTVIAEPEGKIRYNASGNTGLAKGGSGDTLTGIITAFLTQGLNAFDAASCGAYLLGASAEEAYKLLKTRLLTASDLTDAFSSLISCEKRFDL